MLPLHQFQLVISLALGLVCFLISYALKTNQILSILNQLDHYVNIHAISNIQSAVQSLGLFLTLGIPIIIFALRQKKLKTYIQDHSEALTRPFTRHLLFAVIFLVIHMPWIQNGYYFYDDLSHFNIIPELGADIIFANNGGQPYPIYFSLMKILWWVSQGDPIWVNTCIALQVYTIYIFTDLFLRDLKLPVHTSAIFFTLYLTLPQWLSFYCGGYVLMCYIHAIFFFSISLWALNKTIPSIKTIPLILALSCAFLGSISSTSGAWIIPALILWVFCYSFVLQHKVWSSNNKKVIFLLITSLALVCLYHYIFLTFIYTVGNTIRYDYNQSFSFLHLCKNFITISSYILSSPFISTFFQGVAPPGILRTIFTSISIILSLVILSSMVFSTKSTLKRSTLMAYFATMLMGTIFMITMGRYAANLEVIIFHDKYFVMPFYFLAICLAISLSQYAQNKNLFLYIPFALIFFSVQHQSLHVWELIQKNPLRHSTKASNNRKTFYEHWIPHSLDSLLKKHDNVAVPNLSSQQIFSSMATLNSHYDIVLTDLKDFMSYRFPNLNRNIQWRPTERQELPKLKNFVEELHHNPLLKMMYLSPIYFQGHSPLPQKTTVSSQNFSVKNDPKFITLDFPHRKMELNIQHQPLEDANQFHGSYSNLIEIKVYSESDFCKKMHIGNIRLSNLEQSQTQPFSETGQYEFSIDLWEYPGLALSSQHQDVTLCFLTPGSYDINVSAEAMRNIDSSTESMRNTIPQRKP